jgi:hypothetical protein
MEYAEFIESKRFRVESIGKDIEAGAINPKALPLQKAAVKWSVKKGRSILALDTGLGKSLAAMEWATQVGGPSIILAPLAVALQFIEEGKKFGYDVSYAKSPEEMNLAGLTVTNYERFDAFDHVKLNAIVVDECSLLASMDGKYRTHIIERAQEIPYRLGCSATPAPNDYIELGNHAAFLGIMSWQEMAATFFVHDGMSSGDARNEPWRLKGHAEDAFWEWVSSWMLFVKHPEDIGFGDVRYRLPPLEIMDVIVKSDFRPVDQLFATKLSGIQDRAKVRRATLADRVKEAARLIKSERDEQWIAWCGLNDEAAMLAEAVGREAVNLSGDDEPEEKARKIMEFTHGTPRVMVTKAKIAGMGVNLQNATRQVFVGLSDSWKDYYQCMRRSWRFGQKKSVKCWIVLSEIESEIAANVRRKERDAERMGREMVKRMSDLERQEIHGTARESVVYQRDSTKGDNWRLELGDSAEVLKGEPSDSVDLSVYSPPFSSLYTYTNSPRDMGNCRTEAEFFAHFDFFLRELIRVTRPGCLTCCHVSQIAAMASRDGYIGLKDFRGQTIEAFKRVGWVHHGEFTIQKNPQVQAVRTKTKGLMFVTKNKDSRQLRPALADFVLIFRKDGEAAPVKTDVTNDEWIRFAHPCWTDIKETETLSAIEGRDEKDEKHICPLQLEVIHRLIRLYSNVGETVLDPFNGIGSTGFEAIRLGRKYLGIELKRSYFDASVKNIRQAEREANAGDLFQEKARAQ